MDSNNDFEDPAYNLLKKIIALSFLPYKKIREGFEYVETEINTVFSDNIYWKRFIKYYKTKWLEKVKPERFSVFDMIERTNNYYAKYVSTINGRMGNNANTNKLLSK